MDRIELLRARKAALEEAGKAVRDAIRSLFDEDSFVELSAFSFSEGPVYGDRPQGEGVVAGFATIQGFPYYVIAQNFQSEFGGLTRAHCDKIEKTLRAAEKNQTPVVLLLHSQGVKLGEGTEALEGIAKMLSAAAQLKGTVPLYAVVLGEVYGAAALLAAEADAVFFLKESALAVSSPLVLAAKSGKNLKKEEVGGFAALSHTLLPAIEAKDFEEVSGKIARLNEILTVPVIDAELNEPTPALNQSGDAKNVLSALEGAVELGANDAAGVKTYLARVGGISIAAAVFDKAVLNAQTVRKVRDFCELASCYALPFVTFVDCGGPEETLCANDSTLMKEICEYLSMLDNVDTAKIAVVTGRAVGLGYSLFAAKSAGFDFSFALANADISLFENEKGAQILYANEAGEEREELLSRYAAEYADPVNAAKGGLLDNVIEPQFLKQYLIAALQMFLR